MGWEQFRFRRYSLEELQECAKRFISDCARVWNMEDRAAWTEFVLDWFVASRAPESLANARPGRGLWRSFVKQHGMDLEYRRRDTTGSSEFMLDLAHSTYSLAGGKDYWRKQLMGDFPCVMQLALEVEWGSRDCVLEDAAKVAAVRADAKAVITGLSTQAAFDTLRDLEHLRRLTEDRAPWLWINLPSTPSAQDSVFRVVSG